MRRSSGVLAPLFGLAVSVGLLLAAGALWTSASEPAPGLAGMQLSAVGVAVMVAAAGLVPVLAMLSQPTARGF